METITPTASDLITKLIEAKRYILEDLIKKEKWELENAKMKALDCLTSKNQDDKNKYEEEVKMSLTRINLIKGIKADIEVILRNYIYKIENEKGDKCQK